MTKVFHPTTFGQSLIQARAARGLTQQALADALGVARSTIARWETLTAATGHKDGMTDVAIAQLRQFFGHDLITPQQSPSDVTLAYWAGRVEQVAKHMELVLTEQRAIVQDMGGTGEKDARRQRAIEVRPPATPARPAGSKTPPRRRAQG